MSWYSLYSVDLTCQFTLLQNPKNNVVVRFFQLPLSLRNTLLDPNNGRGTLFSKIAL